MKALGLSFLLGLASATGFQPLGLWPFTILAFTGLIVLIEQAPGMRAALARGWWFGMGQFVLGLNWIATAFTFGPGLQAFDGKSRWRCGCGQTAIAGCGCRPYGARFPRSGAHQ